MTISPEPGATAVIPAETLDMQPSIRPVFTILFAAYVIASVFVG